MIKLLNKIYAKMKYGKTVMVAKAVDIQNCTIGEYTNFAHNAEVRNSTIGKRTSVGRYTKVRFADVGKYCAISWNVTIGADAHPTDRISGSAAFFQKRFGLIDKNISKGEVARTKIGNDVLIGCHAIIKSGVKIGDGAIVGSGAVVVNDVLPYEIVVGVPAKKIGMRFDEEKIQKLQESEWWNFEDTIITNNIELFQETMTEEVIDKLVLLRKDRK